MAVNPLAASPALAKTGAAATTATAPEDKDAARQHDRLKKATQEFESVFLGMMLKQMRKSMTGGNALFGNSQEAKMYQDMMDDETAKQMSRTGSFGLARTLCDRLAPKVAVAPETAAPKAAK